MSREPLAHVTFRYLAAPPITGDVVGCQRGHVGIRHHARHRPGQTCGQAVKYVSLGPCSTPMSAHHLFEKGINLAPVAESE